ncbi:HD phosphohydrolase domain-containing protein [Rhizophagus irregularis]|uniref:HD phosphohydrolase domain-containing protein n=1 Tax=Rhizophagus irregularis TaxID=588596 RepID=A0A2I1FV55_9GLOM|nr:HD phosphohydrolase domain-containing protein [Rhizophagus irregularis]
MTLDRYNKNITNNFKKSKRIQDPIHGLMEFENWIIKFIDTEHFQRLRNIKQLGTTYYVYPGASHNRFEHCLGVAHLSRSLVKRIQETQPELEHDENGLKCVTLAALCHDLGHGPFSHLFESEFISQKRPEENWTHEKGSKMMFEHLLNNHADLISDLDTEDITFVENLIAGARTHRSPYLFDIVANKRNSIDVDKFDYLARDCHYLGMRSDFDFSRLMKFSRVIDDQITYYFKESYNIYELFHTRYSLHKKAYNHCVCKAIDYMIRDAFLEADSTLKISDSIFDANEYLKMDDTILNKIEYSDDPSLKKSKDIIKRIRKRDLYKFVDGFLVPNDLKDKLTEKEINEEKIIAYQNNDGLKVDDIIVNRLVLNYGMKNENPVDHVKFYNKNLPNKVFKLEKSQVSYLVPEQFEELNIRIFTKDHKKIDPIRNCFKELLKEYIPKPKTYYNMN